MSQLIPIDMKHSAAAMRFEEKGSNPEESGQNRRFLGPVPEHGPSEPPAGNGPVPAASGESLFHAMRPPFEVEAKTGGPEEEPDICDSLEAPWQEVPRLRRHRKKQRAMELAARSAIIWGFQPARQSLVGLGMALGRSGVEFEALRRGGTGTHHYVELTFVSSVSMTAQFGQLQRTCRDLSLKAVKARNFGLRERHRAYRDGKASPPPPREAAEPSSPQLPPRNPYDPLTSVEGPSENLHMEDVNGNGPDTVSEDEPRSGGSHRIRVNPKFHPTITVGTHNWNGSAFNDAELRAKLYSVRRIDVLAVTDHRLNDQFLDGLSIEGYHWIPGRRPEGLSGGVGFLVRLFLKGFVTELESSYENQKWIRLAPMNGAGDSLPLYIGAAYMPQEGAGDADAAWDALDADAEKYGRLGEVVLLGDLNAKIRCRLRGEESFLGPHCAPPSAGARSGLKLCRGRIRRARQ